MTKTYGDVWAECRSLNLLERRTFTLADQMPPAGQECPADQALVLYLADVLRFEGHEPLWVSATLRHFLDELLAVGKSLAQRIACKARDVPVHEFRVSDERHVFMIGGDRFTPHLDTASWSVTPAPAPYLRSVAYNLTTLMLTRWAGVPLSGRLQTPEKTDDDNRGQAGDAAAGG